MSLTNPSAKHPKIWGSIWILWLLASMLLPVQFVLFLGILPMLALLCIPHWRCGLKPVLLFMLPLAFGFWLIHGGIMSWLITGQSRVDTARQAWAMGLWLRILAVVAASQMWMLLMPFQQLIRFLFASELPLKFTYILASPLILTEQIKTRIKQIREAQMVRGIPTDGNLWQRFLALMSMVSPLIMGLLLDLPGRTAALDLKAFCLYPKRNSLYSDRANEILVADNQPEQSNPSCLYLNKVCLTSAQNKDETVFTVDHLALSCGQWLFVGGGNGSGKSSLAMLLSGAVPEHYPATVTGDIQIFGQTLQDKSCVQWSSSIQLIQQNPLLCFSGCTFTVYDEIAFGMENLLFAPTKIRSNIDIVLKLLDIEYLQDRPLTALSGGEAQKVAIAAALAMEPKLLLLDEAFSRIQHDHAETILQKIKIWSNQTQCAVIVLERTLKPTIAPLFDQTYQLKSKHNTVHTDCYTLAQSLKTKSLTTENLLELKNLSFCWPGTEQPIYKEINKNIAQGEKIALLGNNGAGKSTLFRLCGGLLQSSQGSILLNGQNIHEISVIQRARQIGFLFQEPERQFFHATVREEILFSLRNSDLAEDEKEQRLQQTLTRVQLNGLENKHPLDLDSAQRRMTAIASLDIHPYQLLLLDEPTRELDNYWLDIFIHWLVQKEEAVLMITHDLDLAQALFNKRWILNNGEIEEK